MASGEAEVEYKILDSDSSEEESDSDSEVEVIMSEKAEEIVRQPDLMTTENLATLLITLQGGDGIPPSVPTSEIQIEAEATSEVQVEAENVTHDVEQASNMKQRTEIAPNIQYIGPSSEPNPTMPNDPQVTAPTQETSTQDLDFDFNFDFDFDFPETTHLQPKSSSGVRFDVRSSNGAGFSKHDEAAMCFAANKMKFIEEGDSDDDTAVNVVKLQRRVIVLEQEAALKEAQISSLQAQISSKDQTIEQLQGDVGMLISVVCDLKAKLEKKLINVIKNRLFANPAPLQGGPPN
ncbi:hypothetical protein Hanom_Chr15g01398641 [Helianthus anomalus]